MGRNGFQSTKVMVVTYVKYFTQMCKYKNNQAQQMKVEIDKSLII